MSPEQIIVYARSADPGQTVVYHAEDKLLIAIRDAITQARAEMREEAERVAECMAQLASDDGADEAAKKAWKIAAAIRKLEV